MASLNDNVVKVFHRMQKDVPQKLFHVNRAYSKMFKIVLGAKMETLVDVACIPYQQKHAAVRKLQMYQDRMHNAHG